MKYSASSLSFPQGSVRGLKKLDKRIGIEIFYEFASEDMWNHVLEEAMDHREGEFSIHSPMFYANVGYSDEKELIRELSVPFELYHRFNGQFYVLHSQGEGYIPSDEIERADLRRKVTERIKTFSEICESEGITLVIENLYQGTPGPLFSQEEYIQLFDAVPKAKALIDVGHAVLGRYDIYEVQKALKERLIGYHVHDNDGIRDFHWRMEAENGVVDWDKFCLGVKKYTPDATLVMEYVHAKPDDYTDDMEKFERKMKDINIM
ncbi:MAG: sugar phosphate isomerase/epimerase [Tyzzerella sp.]|nr:sugar phosphate isomerase/epimerase [Tyzzerella sp.]